MVQKKTLSLSESKEKYFKRICEKAHKEWMLIRPCDRCRLISADCHKFCGIINKWNSRIRDGEI